MKKPAQGKRADLPDLQSLEKEIGKRIRKRRQELGLTQQDLARKLGLSYQQVQKYETGLNRISAGRLFLVSRLLLANMDYFFDHPGAKSQNGRQLPLNPVLFLPEDSIDSEIETALLNLVSALTKNLH